MAATPFFLSTISASTPGDSQLPLYDHLPGCPDGSRGRVTQIQEERADPFQPAIYITDCSPSWRNATASHETPPSGQSNSRIMKRQEQICPADCSNSCSGGTKPSTSDCANLVTYLNNRASTFTVQGFQTVTTSSGTCLFSLGNDVSSSYIYCDTAWASRSNGVINSCLGSSSGGKCQGSRFYAQVSYNEGYTPPQQQTTPASTPTPTSDSGSGNNGNSGNNNGSGSSSANNGGNNGGNSSNGSGNGNGNSGTNTGGANTATTDRGGSNSGSTGASQSNGQTITSGQTTAMTTLAGGVVIPIATGVINGPGNSDQDSSAQVGDGPNRKTTNTAAIVGSLLGFLALIGLIIGVLLLRRRKRRLLREQQLAYPHQMEEFKESTSQHDFDIAHSREDVTEDSQNDPPGNSYPTREAQATRIPAGRVLDTSLTGLPAKTRQHSPQNRHRPTASDLESSSEPSRDTISHTRNTSINSDSRVPPYTNGGPSEGERDRLGALGAAGRHQRRGTRGSSRGDRDSYSVMTRTSDRSYSNGRQSRETNNINTSSDGVSPRALAQAAAPQLSDGDIERLAESIVSRMQGRDPAIYERALYASEGGSILEEEPPPPWTASNGAHR